MSPTNIVTYTAEGEAPVVLPGRILALPGHFRNLQLVRVLTLGDAYSLRQGDVAGGVDFRDDYVCWGDMSAVDLVTLLMTRSKSKTYSVAIRPSPWCSDTIFRHYCLC